MITSNDRVQQVFAISSQGWSVLNQLRKANKFGNQAMGGTDNSPATDLGEKKVGYFFEI